MYVPKSSTIGSTINYSEANPDVIAQRNKKGISYTLEKLIYSILLCRWHSDIVTIVLHQKATTKNTFADQS